MSLDGNKTQGQNCSLGYVIKENNEAVHIQNALISVNGNFL